MSAIATQNNRFFTSFSIIAVLFILGIFGLLMLHSQYVGHKVKEQLNIVIEFTDDYKAAEKEDLLNQLKNHEAIIESSIAFHDKAGAKDVMLGDMAEEYLMDDADNPFRDMLVFNVASAYYKEGYIDNLADHLKSRSFVKDVVYQKDFERYLDQLIKEISIIPLILSILLTILSISLIYNTVRLTLESDKKKIKTMELVGASHSFIKRPYMSSALKIGLISAFIAIILLFLLIQLMSLRIPDIQPFINYQYIAIICVLLLVIGVLIPYIATSLIVSKYLKHIYISSE